VDGTATSLPVSACGAVTKVRGRTTTTMQSPPDADVGENVPVQVTLTGLPFPDSVHGTVTLYGPYTSEGQRQADGCASSGQEQPFLRTQGNGTFLSPSISMLAPGLYAWQVEIDPDDLWLGSESPCLAPGTLMSVS
jgi:hypothetical protein